MLSADRTRLRADGHDLCFVKVAVTDGDGELVPRASSPIRFEIEGPGAIVAVDNGDPTSFEPFQASERRAFNGLALVVVKTRAGRGGRITLRASSEGLAPGLARLTSVG